MSWIIKRDIMLNWQICVLKDCGGLGVLDRFGNYEQMFVM